MRCFKVKYLATIPIILLCLRISLIRATLFVFLVEDSAIFSDCKNEPDFLGVKDVVDLSDLSVEPLEDSVHLEGSFQMLWDADPNDRIELKSELFKYERGSWQPTVFTMVLKDFCSTLFEEGDAWYTAWMQYVNEEDRKCINNKGHVYHHEPFNLETVVDVNGEDLSGKHKVVIKVDAYDQEGNKRPNSICLEVLGDIVKK
ncbi:uncharacterized protein ACRADG_010735 [Cochliomyia hominivorax]